MTSCIASVRRLRTSRIMRKLRSARATASITPWTLSVRPSAKSSTALSAWAWRLLAPPRSWSMTLEKGPSPGRAGPVVANSSPTGFSPAGPTGAMAMAHRLRAGQRQRLLDRPPERLRHPQVRLVRPAGGNQVDHFDGQVDVRHRHEPLRVGVGVAGVVDARELRRVVRGPHDLNAARNGQALSGPRPLAEDRGEDDVLPPERAAVGGPRREGVGDVVRHDLHAQPLGGHARAADVGRG